MDPHSKEPVFCLTNQPIQNGVTTIPINPEIVALNMAAGTFPFAIETITTEEETVEGNAAKNINDNQIIWPFSDVMKGFTIKTNKGNKRNVENCINKWSFTFFRSFLISEILSLKRQMINDCMTHFGFD